MYLDFSFQSRAGVFFVLNPYAPLQRGGGGVMFEREEVGSDWGRRPERVVVGGWGGGKGSLVGARVRALKPGRRSRNRRGSALGGYLVWLLASRQSVIASQPRA